MREGWVGGPLCEILNTPLFMSLSQSRSHVRISERMMSKLCIGIRDFNYFALQTGKLNGFSLKSKSGI